MAMIRSDMMDDLLPGLNKLFGETYINNAGKGAPLSRHPTLVITEWTIADDVVLDGPDLSRYEDAKKEIAEMKERAKK
jgi:hypothetical protein